MIEKGIEADNYKECISLNCKTFKNKLTKLLKRKSKKQSLTNYINLVQSNHYILTTVYYGTNNQI